MGQLKNFFAGRWGMIGVGAFIGVLAALLQKLGNPGNMGICVACFERDIAGAVGLHRAAVVQYMRPEIIGFVLGSLIADAGFMYAAKMSGQASKYDLFTPDVGELAFLADEEAPHLFYTRLIRIFLWRPDL